MINGSKINLWRTVLHFVKVLFFSLSLLGLLFFYQNCSDVGFQANSESIDLNSESNETNENQDSQGHQGSDSQETPEEEPDSSDDSVMQTEYQTLHPMVLSSSVFLKNPGIGLEQAGKIKNDGSFAYNNAYDDKATITYIRLPWVILEGKGDNQWNWSDLDAAIENSIQRGKQAAISVISWRPILDNNNYKEAMPNWYYQDPRHVRCTDKNTPAGCTYYLVSFSGSGCTAQNTTCTDRWAFNHDDPEFVRQQVELIDALRARYDKPEWAEKIAYMDVRSIGAWSESHTTSCTVKNQNYRWPMPQWNSFKKILDAHLNFQFIPQIFNFDNDDRYLKDQGPHPWDYACTVALQTGAPVGWRTDGIEVTLWEIDKVMDWSPAAKECWKLGPVYAEAMDGAGLQAADLTEGLRRLTQWRASGFNNKYASLYPFNASYKTEVDQWLLNAGYRLSVDTVRLPKVVQEDRIFDIEVSLINSGNAPFYRNFYNVEVMFEDVISKQQFRIPLSGSLLKLLPGAHAKFFGTADLPQGEYSVFVGVIQQSAFGNLFPIQLAQDESLRRNTQDGNWYQLGSTIVP
ncbi:MAG: DUF4832 domain-containing protein [Bdellovibrionales bacterium]|nr:DUF4832 domain-containing protein [Bdellovibrionales bacterium]